MSRAIEILIGLGVFVLWGIYIALDYKYDFGSKTNHSDWI